MKRSNFRKSAAVFDRAYAGYQTALRVERFDAQAHELRAEGIEPHGFAACRLSVIKQEMLY